MVYDLTASFLRRLITLWTPVDGNISVAFALSLLPISAMSMMAVEYRMLTGLKASYQQAVDASALAGASAASNADAIARSTFESNAPNKTYVTVLSHGLDTSSGDYVYAANATYSTMAGGLVGLNSIEFSVSATAVKHMVPAADMAIVLDTTGSMSGGGLWSDVTLAMTTALTNIESTVDPNRFFISFLPYKDRVNIGASRSSWATGDTSGSWNGCVEPREEMIGSYDFALDETPPTGADRFVASNGLTGGLWERNSAYPHCPDELVPPTNSVSSITTAFQNVTRSGTGRWDVGLAWGWRLLSPRWGTHWNVAGYPSATPDARRMLVYIVDGKSTAYDWEMRNDISGPSDPDLGAPAPDTLGYNKGTTTAFDHLEDLCARIKADGIELLVMHIGGHSHARAPLEACATSEGHYFEVSDLDEWTAAFQFTENQFTTVRLSK